VFPRKDGSFGVRTMGDHIWGSIPQPPAKKTAKYKNRNIYKTINTIKTTFGDEAETNDSTSWMD